MALYTNLGPLSQDLCFDLSVTFPHPAYRCTVYHFLSIISIGFSHALIGLYLSSKRCCSYIFLYYLPIARLMTLFPTSYLLLDTRVTSVEAGMTITRPVVAGSEPIPGLLPALSWVLCHHHHHWSCSANPSS